MVPVNQLTTEQEQSDNVPRVGDEQNRRQSALRLPEQPIQLQRGRHAALHILPQPHWIDRKQSAFYPVKEKRNDPATHNHRDRDSHGCHGESVPWRTASSNAFVVFSSSTSSILLRLARRTVIARRGISSFVPDEGT